MTIGERIKYLRSKLNIAQVELANKAELSKQTLYKYENNIITNIPSDKIEIIAKILETTPSYLMGWNEEDETPEVPILGTVPCGQPIEAIEDIIGYMDVPNAKMKQDHFGLVAKGDSMMPRIEDGDLLLVKQTTEVPSGSIAIIKVNGDDATCKKVLISKDGITLIPLNPLYEAKHFSPEECQSFPVSIIGKVVEIRRTL